jgi:hypothetical protein
VLPGRLVGGRGKARIPLTTTTTAGGNKGLPFLLTIPQDFVRISVFTDGPDRHTEDEVFATFPVHIFAFAVGATLGKMKGTVLQIEEGLDGAITLEDNGPTISAIPTIRTTTGDELFPTEAHASITPVAATHQNFCFVNDAEPFQGPSSFTTPDSQCTAGKHPIPPVWAHTIPDCR